MIGYIGYTVKIDLIVQSNAGIFIMDHKTTKTIPYNYFWQFTPNMQITGYCLYAKKKYGQCSGAIINAAQVGFRERAYKGNPAGFHCNFTREIINRDTDQYKDFQENIMMWSGRLNMALDHGIYPKNESACHQFKGCGFKELCSTCDDEEIKSTLYIEYDPYAYLKENDEVSAESKGN